MFSVLVIRLRSLRLLRVSGIVMRLRMFLLLITFLKASHSFRNRLISVVSQRESVKNDKPTISMSLSHCIHQTLNSKASTRFHSGGFAIQRLMNAMRQEIGRAVQQECRDRSRMPSSA